MRKTLSGILLCTLAVLCQPQQTSAQEIYARAAQLSAIAQDDPAAALQEIEAILKGDSFVANQDFRLQFDLVQLRVDLLLQLGQDVQAANWLGQLAKFAADNRAVLSVDPIRLYDQAAEIYQGLGDLRSARSHVQAIIEEQRDGGQSAAIIAHSLNRLADLYAQDGRTEKAQEIRDAAALSLRQPDAATRGKGKGYREVEVFYATDRARSGAPEPGNYYGWGRGALELGLATVTIPDSHTKGQIETYRYFKLEFGPNPAKHIVLQSVVPTKKDAFYAYMNAQLEERVNKELFVFIHGYNVGFEQAAKRAAQISYDMNYGGLPVLYSWPSAGSAFGYISDTAVVRLSGRRLSEFLDDLVLRSGARNIHIVAHSMGNRALTDALELMSLRHDITAESDPIFDQILFAAPDVDAGLFAQMIQTIRPIARRLTLYSSSEDWALASSRRLHGNAPRAGQGGEFVLVSDNVDSVDMSELGEDMLAHSYFADDSSALADMMSLFWQNTSPRRRCGLNETTADGLAKPYFVYKRSSCGSQNMIDAMSVMQRGHAATKSDVLRLLKDAVEDSAVREGIEPLLLRMVSE